MSRESVQWAEMVREAWGKLTPPPGPLPSGAGEGGSRAEAEGLYQRLWCQACGKETQHVYLGEQGIYERYQCPCGLIRSVAVR